VVALLLADAVHKWGDHKGRPYGLQMSEDAGCACRHARSVQSGVSEAQIIAYD